MYLHTQTLTHLRLQILLTHSPSYLTFFMLSSSRGWKLEMDLKQKYMLSFIMSIFQGENGL